MTKLTRVVLVTACLGLGFTYPQPLCMWHMVSLKATAYILAYRPIAQSMSLLERWCWYSPIPIFRGMEVILPQGWNRRDRTRPCFFVNSHEKRNPEKKFIRYYTLSAVNSPPYDGQAWHSVVLTLDTRTYGSKTESAQSPLALVSVNPLSLVRWGHCFRS